MDTYGLYRGVRMFLLMQIGASLGGVVVRYTRLEETMVHKPGKRPPIMPNAETFRGCLDPYSS